MIHVDNLNHSVMYKGWFIKTTRVCGIDVPTDIKYLDITEHFISGSETCWEDAVTTVRKNVTIPLITKVFTVLFKHRRTDLKSIFK